MNFGAEFGLALGFFSLLQTAFVYWRKGFLIHRWHQSTQYDQLGVASLRMDAQLKKIRLASLFSGFFVGLSVFFIITGESAYRPSVNDISLPYFFLVVTKTMLSIFVLMVIIFGLLYCAGAFLVYAKDKKHLLSMVKQIQQKAAQKSVPRTISKDFGVAIVLTVMAVLDGWLLVALSLHS